MLASFSSCKSKVVKVIMGHVGKVMYILDSRQLVAEESRLK